MRGVLYHSRFDVACQGCDTTTRADAPDIAAAAEAIRREGWRKLRVGDDGRRWHCPSCPKDQEAAVSEGGRD